VTSKTEPGGSALRGNTLTGAVLNQQIAIRSRNMVGMMGASASTPAAVPASGTDKALEMIAFFADPAKAKAAIEAFAAREAAAKQAETNAKADAKQIIAEAKTTAAGIVAEALAIKATHQAKLDALKKEMASYVANIEALKETP